METTNLPALQDNYLQALAQSAPDAYHRNTTTVARCNDAGNAILQQLQGGMTDALDQRCAEYLENTRSAIKKMNGRRAPITKLFDQIRAEFTSMENAIDPTKKDTVPYLIQQARNAYAAKKRAEAEEARQKELLKRQRAQAINQYFQNVEDDYRATFNQALSRHLQRLTDLNAAITLENFDAQAKAIADYPVTLPADTVHRFESNVIIPLDLDIEAQEIQLRQRQILYALYPSFTKTYTEQTSEYRDSILDTLPAKREQLQRIAQASAEEAERLKAQLAKDEAAESQRLQEEQQRKAQEEADAAALKAQATEINDLFSQASTAAPLEYQPKTSVKKMVVPHNANGILDIIGMWWSLEGQHMPLDELTKAFKKQITFVNRMANDRDNPQTLSSPNLHYEEEVKAK